jgi:hypothetical protein
MEKINILWTGGFDSTQRVCQLSFFEIYIQPYYIRVRRRSEPNELKAMSAIAAYIESQKTTKCVLLPVIIVTLDELPDYPDIEASWKNLYNYSKLGSQYAWFARLARKEEIYLELGIEYDPEGRAARAIREFGKTREVNVPVPGTEGFGYTEIDKAESSDDLINLYERMRFGIPLFYMSKLQTLEAYKQMGYEAVIQMTWFCAHPIIGKPCGLCNPCETVMHTHMGYRLPWWSRLFYILLKGNFIGRRVDRKLKSIYNRNFREEVV